MKDKRQTNFKLVGLQYINNKTDVIATCELFDKEETFQTPIKGTIKEKKEMFKYCKNNWDNKIAVIESDYDLYPNGMPRNPLLLYMIEK